MSWKETDILELWKNSTVVPLQSAKENNVDEIVEKTYVGQRLAGSRSKLWTSVSEMTPEERKLYLNRLVKAWPFDWERRAVTYPYYFSSFATLLSSTVIGLLAILAAKINSDIHLCNPNVRLLDALRNCTRIPVLTSAYVSGLTHFIFYHKLIYTPIMGTDERPCASCVLSRNFGLSLLTGVILPTVTTPHLSYHLLIKSEPKGKSGYHIDLITLSYEYSRAVWRKLPLHIAGQLAIAVCTAFSLLWGRNRMFETMDVDPELVRERVAREKEEEKNRWAYKLSAFAQKYNFSKKQLSSTVIKSQDDKDSWI